MLVSISKGYNVYKKPDTKSKIIAILIEKDIVFIGRSFIVNHEKWTKVELCQCIGYINNIQFGKIIVAIHNTKEKNIYEHPRLDSNVSFVMKESETFFILSKINIEGSTWYKIITCNTRLEGYFYVSESAIESYVREYNIIKNSFRMYYLFILSKGLRIKVRSSILIGLLLPLTILFIIVFLRDNINYHAFYFFLVLSLFLMLFMPLFSSWFSLKYVK